MTVPAALAEVPHGRDPVRLLVALDGSDHARVALEVVACLPLTAADLVVLLSVADTGPATAHQLRRRQGQDLDELLRDRWAAERTAARQAVKAAGAALAGWDTPVRQLARGGPVIETIAAAAAELEASLLVVGPRGRNPLTDLLVGSVAHALLGRVHCPVLVGREPVGAPTQILLAVDGSPHGRAATRALVTYPRAATVVVTVVAVAPSDDAGARAHAETSAAEAIAALSAVGFAAGSAISV
ncbi:MAG: universal stress protein, partial [Chloroflexi bacterium]|nr:universal stress protein [Chloroflexota bacterium]